MPDDDWALAQGTVDFRNEERRARHHTDQIRVRPERREMEFMKVVRPGTVPGGSDRHRVDVFCKITYRRRENYRREDDFGELSITGVIGPYASGNAYGGCGQIAMEFAHRDPASNDERYSTHISVDDMRFADGWSAETWLDFLDIWKRWHLNTMQSACEHQRALGWRCDDAHLDRPTCPRCSRQLEKVGRDDGTSYMRCPSCFYDGGGSIEPPPGFPHAGLPCPECGYRIGSAWLAEPVPLDVLDFLRSLPDADREPAWV